MVLPKSIRDLIDQFAKLPGIGPKSAARLAFYLLHQKDEDVAHFGNVLLNFKKNLVLCNTCQNISEDAECDICADQSRERNILCVVSEPLDVVAMEKGKTYRGLYHILHGQLSPINNVRPDDLKIKELIDRIELYKPQEIILATNANMEGEATASFIHQKIKNFDLKITRIARGLPVGGDIEYADETTIMRALEGRMTY